MEEMKKIETQAAQGDIYIRRAAVPNVAVPKASEAGRVVVAHSETGHHHYLDAAGVEAWAHPTDPLVCYLRIAPGLEAGGGVLRHARPYDTHAPLLLPAGTWEIRRQREMTPEGWRRVED